MQEIRQDPLWEACSATPLVGAAQYVRMSTEHQQYSTQNQRDAIAQYAARRGFEIVRTYEDDGKSGLRLDGRDSLKRLIEDVECGAADFEVILVYDISRWGRFQDADESAYYEYICKRAGIRIEYCAEHFENDGSPVSTIVKGVKRAMAGEYSRELSVKVFAGQCRLIELGYRQGGPAGFGLRRVLVDQSGNYKNELRRGEHKSLQTDRVILMPGPDHEVGVVNQIYRWFVNDGLLEKEIAERLNGNGLTTDTGRPWTRGTVHQMLINEKYIGNNVFNRKSFKLKQKRVKNPPEIWVRRDGAFEGVVDSELFYTAQGMIRERARRFSNQDLIALLQKLHEQHGTLSGIIIDETDGMPSSSVYRKRFGSLLRAYALVGYLPERDYQFIEVNKRLRAMHPVLVADVLSRIEALGGTVSRDMKTDLLTINGEFTTSIVLARCKEGQTSGRRWTIRLDAGLMPDITVAVRMAPGNVEMQDYYLLPMIDMTASRLLLANANGLSLDAYRFDNLDFFFAMAERVSLRDFR